MNLSAVVLQSVAEGYYTAITNFGDFLTIHPSCMSICLFIRKGLLRMYTGQFRHKCRVGSI